MNYQVNNDEDEFEPRVTPKPASILDGFAVPCVPEVSLIFDKPSGHQYTQYHRSSTVQPKDLTRKTNGSSPLTVNGSYAAWKEENYSWKTPKTRNCTNPQKVVFDQNSPKRFHSTESNVAGNLNKSREKNCGWKKDMYIERSSEHENKNNQNNRNKSKIQHGDSMSAVPHVSKPCISSDNYIVKDKDCYSSVSYEKKLISQGTKQQKLPYNESRNESNFFIDPNNLQRKEVQLPCYLGQQYPYFNPYPFPQLNPYSAPDTDNQETLKNLLQIINSQNEQIISLQTQVNRLLKMQEESMKERKQCSCSGNSNRSNARSNRISDSSNFVTVPEKNMYQRESSKDKKQEPYNENDIINQNELRLTDAQSKKSFMEQKVSIGVMTSFEFTVQNSPFTVNIEDHEKRDSQLKAEQLKICNTVGLSDTSESLRRYKNSFSRIPSAQLENIIEDSESYMSSSQQQSSNLNASTSTKELEKQTCADVRRGTNRCDFVRGAETRLNETENNVMKRVGGICTEEARNFETDRASITRRNAEYNIPENRNFETNTPIDRNEYKRPIRQQDNDSVKSEDSMANSDYYRSYQKKGQVFESKQTNCIEESLILNGDNLKINERPPTPEPSIHVEMHEYSSDDDSEKVKRSSKVGWTFYNNVLGQVNQLLQNSAIADDQQQKINQNERDENTENRTVLDTVKVATLEQLKKLGISLSENPEAKDNNKMAFDLSFYPRLDYQTNMTQATSGVNETNTSMHMKALALKYLTDEQLAELAVQRQGSLKHLMVSNMEGTNMSFATMRYLERYQLLPGKNNPQTEDIGRVQTEVLPKVDLKFTNPKNSPKALHFPSSQTPRTTCPTKILDISTLKQQPKLL